MIQLLQCDQQMQTRR